MSITARRVAIARLSMERVAADLGDPDAEERFIRALAAEEPEGPPGAGMGEAMRRHLQGRTRYFDRVVVNAIARGARQVVILGAGYDGRALRYGHPDVRFFEVDRAATQADKRARLGALGVGAGAVTFVAFDLADPGLDDALRAAGFDPDAPSALLCEGLFVYLTPEAIILTLDALRALAAPRTRLAVSMTAPGRRATEDNDRFREHVAAAGEPTGNVLDADELRELMAEHRWRGVELPEPATRAGFVMGAPEWAPAPRGVPATAGRVARYLERAMYRAGGDTLTETLARDHGLVCRSLRELDVGVFDVRVRDGRRCIVRVFPAAQPREAVQRDVRLLRQLRARGFPAERPVAEAPVGAHAGQPLLITEFVPGAAVAAGAADGARAAVTPRRLGELLGQLQTLRTTETELGPGGAWHHLVPEGGPPAAELATARELLHAARARVAEPDAALHARLTEALVSADDGAGLPEALAHPDLVAANARGPEPTIVDWAGCGIGPRIWPLAFLLWSVGIRGAAAVMEGYGASVTLEAQERERLPGTIIARPAVLAAWTFAVGRRSLTDAVADVHDLEATAQRLVERALSGRA